MKNFNTLLASLLVIASLSGCSEEESRVKRKPDPSKDSLAAMQECMENWDDKELCKTAAENKSKELIAEKEARAASERASADAGNGMGQAIVSGLVAGTVANVLGGGHGREREVHVIHQPAPTPAQPVKKDRSQYSYIGTPKPVVAPTPAPAPTSAAKPNFFKRFSSSSSTPSRSYSFGRRR